ncbi:hypothetical protein MACH17_11700 [Phaeobacter inhibens]|nr:hypothetical protein MACH17_11700 [Phaeobacter inhibens]
MHRLCLGNITGKRQGTCFSGHLLQRFNPPTKQCEPRALPRKAARQFNANAGSATGNHHMSAS